MVRAAFLLWIGTICIFLSGCLDVVQDDSNDATERGDSQTTQQEDEFGIQEPAMRITEKNASQLTLHLSDMNAGWQNRRAEDIEANETGLTSAHRTELIRQQFKDPVHIETHAHVFSSTQDAESFFDATRGEVEANRSTEDRDIGSEAFYYEKAPPHVILHVREGNAVWFVTFKGQAGYFWDPKIQDIGELLVDKF